MVIGFDGSRAFIEKKTGTENYSYQLLHNLSLIDQKNTYIVYLRPRVQGTGYSLPAGKAGVQFPKNFHFVTIPYSRLWTQVGLAKQTFIDKLDVLFIPAHTLPIIRKPGLRTVVTVHDLGAEYLPTTHQLKQRLYLKHMTAHQLKTATHLIAVSQATKQDLISKVKIPAGNISVVYEGYNNRLYSKRSDPEVNKITAAYGLAPNAYFLFVGTIQPRKNLARLIQAYAEFIKTLHPTPYTLHPKLALAGSKGWLSDEIYKLPKQLGIEDQVKFLEYVPDQDLPALYSGAIAFLFPSLFEGFGLPVLEAMACECPVLTSNVSSLPEVAGQAAVLVNPHSVKDIASGIARVQSTGCRVQLIPKGLRQVKKFSWKSAAEETLQNLEKVAKSS